MPAPDDPLFPNRDEEPGLTPDPTRAIPPQLEEFYVESTAVHSRERGWLPAVTITLLVEGGLGLTAVVAVDETWYEILDHLIVATERAPLDLATAQARGQLP